MYYTSKKIRTTKKIKNNNRNEQNLNLLLIVLIKL